MNVIDCDLDAYELGRQLVLAAQSAGVGASEPYWFVDWQNLFSAAIYLLMLLGHHDGDDDVLTLRALIDAVLTVERPDPLLTNDAPQRRIQERAARARERVDKFPAKRRAEILAAVNQIELFYGQKPDNIATVETLITQAYGEFLRTRTDRFAPSVPRSTARTPLYDQIIDDGKIVLVSVSPADPGLAKVLCTLVKNLFMQSTLSRLARVRSPSHALSNFERPVVLACDEYSQIASEIPGQVGDGDFFSKARQQGCMGLLATQSVDVLQATTLKDNWKSIFSNFGAKIFMRAADNETAEAATKLAGEADYYETSVGTTSGAQGLGSSTQKSLKERKVLPSRILTGLIETGEGVVLGTLDGKAPSVSFFSVPPT